MQVYGDWQVKLPFHCWPPHCAYWARAVFAARAVIFSQALSATVTTYDDGFYRPIHDVQAEALDAEAARMEFDELVNWAIAFEEEEAEFARQRQMQAHGPGEGEPSSSFITLDSLRTRYGPFPPDAPPSSAGPSSQGSSSSNMQVEEDEDNDDTPRASQGSVSGKGKGRM